MELLLTRGASPFEIYRATNYGIIIFLIKQSPSVSYYRCLSNTHIHAHISLRNSCSPQTRTVTISWVYERLLRRVHQLDARQRSVNSRTRIHVRVASTSATREIRVSCKSEYFLSAKWDLHREAREETAV